VSDTSTGLQVGQWREAQVEYDEAVAGGPGMSPQIKAKIEAMESAQQERPASPPASNTSDTSDPTSVPATVLALLGGGLVAGAAGYTVYRFRHHGQVGAATA
jgi:hypothetical protein